MAPLLVLLITFVLAVVAIRFSRQHHNLALAGRIALSVMLLFTAIGHFVFTDGMALMLPQFIPYKTAMVYFTGIVEILAAMGLQVRKYRKLTAWLLILFFILVLPANLRRPASYRLSKRQQPRQRNSIPVV